jgi:glyoxylase-like metal-dependent hydrolase (beta-lactamase superfamily II)
MAALHESPAATSALTYPLAPPAPDGSVVEVAPGIVWARMPMPMALDHINVYLLRDDDGWYLVDTGLSTPATQDLWEKITSEHLQGLPVKAVLCTHFHYDHAGLAHWLCERFGVPLYMTYGEYYMLRAMFSPVPDPLPTPQQRFFDRAGIPAERLDAILATLRADHFLPAQPMAFRRLRGGQSLHIGGRIWRVVIGEGHSPEHACLYCEQDRILIAGDQLLPGISSNIQVTSVEPEENPLKAWIDSLGRLEHLAPDTLVLPSHQDVFRGLHARVQQLRDHHARHLARLRTFVDRGEGCSTYEAMGAMFPHVSRPMDTLLALGEAIAHLTWLCDEGDITRTLEPDGVYRFRALGQGTEGTGQALMHS